MLGSHPSSIFDSPSFIQRILKKKSTTSKGALECNVRPLYTSDIVTTKVGPWKKQQQQQLHVVNSQQGAIKKTKIYNRPSYQHNYGSKAPERPAAAPALTPSMSSNTASSLFLSDSSFINPMASFSTPTQQQKRKRPLSSEILIKIMDQLLLKQQQQHQLEESAPIINLNRSSSTSMPVKIQKPPLLKHKILPKPSLVSVNNNISSTASRHNSLKINYSSTRRCTQPQTSVNAHLSDSNTSNKKLKTSNKNVLTKLQPYHIHKSTSSNSSSSSSSSSSSDSQQQELPYVLNQDNDEQDRMVAQHYLLRTAFGSDFVSPVHHLLQKGCVVLDIGCGPGTWTMEMSTAFPRSTFIGIDQACFYPQDIKPKNCHFRTCDALTATQHQLPFPDNSIDFIYQRDLNWGLEGQTWHPLLQEYQRVLKPGGWVEFTEPDLETHNSLERECSMNDKLVTGLSTRQQDPYAVHRLPTMLSINGFRRVEDVSQSLPLGWGLSHSSSSVSDSPCSSDISEQDDQKEQPRPCSEFARAMSSQYLFLLKSLKPWLSLVMNLDHEKYDEYISGLPAEWTRAKTHINWHCIIAQKPYHL